MLQYVANVINELRAPLFVIHSGAMDGRGAVATALLCEILLSLLPTMSLKDRPYQLLKDYHITPIESGVIGRMNRLYLRGLAVLRGGVLYVPTTVVHKVFIPLRHLPATGKKQVIAMLKFLQTLYTRNLQDIKKCTQILLTEYISAGEE